MISRIAVIDFETTGQNPHECHVIEAAIASVPVLPGGGLGEVDVRYESFNDPGYPIPANIITLTGITDGMVTGHQIDWVKFNEVCAGAELLVAHNARFDRGFLEVHGKYNTRHWGCSSSMIEWRTHHRMPCGHLKHLAWEHEHFPQAHRAMADVDTVVHLLRLKSRGMPERTYLEEMLTNALRKHYLVTANDSPFETKDVLREQRFRWNNKQRVWFKVVPEDQLEKVEIFLREKVYGGAPRHKKLEVDPLDPWIESL